MQYKKELQALLVRLGMGIVFQGRADFTGIGNTFRISDVIHKAYVDVKEEGTEAAAVTGVIVVGTAAPPSQEKTFYMEVNRPFFFAIRDNETKEILLTGAVQNP
jgi:serpin B